MAAQRTYGEACGIAHALDLAGERWALLIVRDLLLGPKRFTDLQAGLPRAGPTILAQRLHDLEAAGVVGRHTQPPPSGARVYELTEWGARLGPILIQLGRWGLESPVRRHGELTADSVMLSLRSSFRSDSRHPWNARYEIRLGADRFTAAVAGGKLSGPVRGERPEPADAVIETDPATLDAVLSGDLDLAGTVASGRLRITGDRVAARRLLRRAAP